MNNPERTKLAARIQDVVRLGDPVYALTERDLGVSDAVAVIIRDPNPGPMSRVIVFARETLTDAVVACARGTLMQSEIGELEHAERRVITVWSDGRYEVREGERRSMGNRPWTGALTATGAATHLKDAATGNVVFLPEVGRVRIVLPDGPTGEA